MLGLGDSQPARGAHLSGDVSLATTHCRGLLPQGATHSNPGPGSLPHTHTGSPGLPAPLTMCSSVPCRALKATQASKGMREKPETLERT